MKVFQRTLFFLALLALGACGKNRNNGGSIVEGGNVTVTARVMHHTWFVPGSRVFIKANVTLFPGTDTTVYDSYKVADAYGYVLFDKVGNGNYYLYGKGFDPNVAKPVWGYVPFSVNVVPGETKEIDIELPVSE